MRILIVEDEKNLASALVKLLEGQKYAAEAVYDGQTGLDYARSGQYDALILDVMLPGLSGFQIASTLREEGLDVPILMLTARDKVADKVRGLDSGADDYLPNPLPPRSCWRGYAPCCGGRARCRWTLSPLAISPCPSPPASCPVRTSRCASAGRSRR